MFTYIQGIENRLIEKEQRIIALEKALHLYDKDFEQYVGGNHITSVVGNGNEYINGTKNETVMGQKKVWIENENLETYNNGRKIKISTQDKEETIDKNNVLLVSQEEHRTITGKANHTYKNDLNQIITKNHYLSAKTEKVETTGDVTHTYGGVFKLKSKGDHISNKLGCYMESFVGIKYSQKLALEIGLNASVNASIDAVKLGLTEVGFSETLLKLEIKGGSIKHNVGGLENIISLFHSRI